MIKIQVLNLNNTEYVDEVEFCQARALQKYLTKSQLQHLIYIGNLIKKVYSQIGQDLLGTYNLLSKREVKQIITEEKHKYQLKINTLKLKYGVKI